MRFAVVLCCAGALLAGCMHRSPRPEPPPQSAPPHALQQPKPVIQPNFQPEGQVAMVNTDARFVVISFPDGSVPPKDRQLYVYRNGLKVGALRVTGPQRENDTVADILSGDVQIHDRVRVE